MLSEYEAAAGPDGTGSAALRRQSGLKGNDKDRERRFHLWGWILFVVCAGFFIASAVESGSTLGVIGSVVFLVACGVFIVPLVTGGRASGRE